MTLNMTGPEMVALNELSDKTGMSKTDVMRQALRFYQLAHHRMSKGERMYFSGDHARSVEFAGLALAPAQAMSAGTAETQDAAQGEARQRGPKDAPEPPAKATGVHPHE